MQASELQNDSRTRRAARRYCRQLVQTHYENFTVVSWLLPRELHPHFYHIYAYCRRADDLADEVTNSQGRYDAQSQARSLERLQGWRRQLLRCYGSTCPGATPAPESIGASAHGSQLHADEPWHPVMIALSETIQKFSIPKQPFLDLLLAFEQDQRVAEYETYEQLLGYCRYSANPVGRLVLYLCRAFDEQSAELSDCICTGLQLANFWQDVARDLRRGRVYLPREDYERFGYRHAQLHEQVYNETFCELMRLQVARARQWFHQGLPLVRRMPAAIQVDIELFARGGLTILDKIEHNHYNVWQQRPVLSKWDHVRLLARCVGSRLWRATRGNNR